MKIGFSTFVMEGGRSGIAAHIRNLLGALQREDAENSYDLLMARDEADLVPLSNPGFGKTLYPPWLNQPLANLAWHNLGLPQKRYDLLHIPSSRRIPLLKRTRVLATVHDLATFSVDAKYDRARMFFNRRIVPAMIRRADHVITVSHHAKNDLVRWARYPEEHISVIYPGIDHALFRPVQKDEARRQLAKIHGLEKPFFAYVSRLEHPGKNHLRLIEAFELFKKRNDSSHQLVLAGADWNGADAIRARAAESPVKDDIVFLGFAPSESIPLLYSGCDLMVFPSLFEGFGLPIVEALACGAPVACSNTSSMRELAGNRIPTFDPTCVDEIFQTLENALSRDWKRGESARLEYARGFDWAQTARKTIQIYHSVAAT